MLLLLLLLLVFFPVVYSKVNNYTVCYLNHYGYMQGDALTEDITPALELFQETYGLTVSGRFDRETEDFMNLPRCGNKDELLHFAANLNQKWNFTSLTWFMMGTSQYDTLINDAFNVWSRHTNLTFRKSFRDANIKMSFSNRTHINYSRREVCSYNLDGSGGVLAHAFIPDLQTTSTDIHFDVEEPWDFSMNLPVGGKRSFYLTLVHEIGHALGLGHSFVNTSIMWAISQVPRGIANLHEFELSQDDRLAVQFLYGRPSNETMVTIRPTTEATTPETTTDTPTQIFTTSASTTTTVTPIENLLKLDVCDIRQDIDTVAIVNKRIYIFYKRYVWVLHLNKAHRKKEDYTSPLLLSMFIQSLPANFTRVRAVYQRPNGQVVIFIDNSVYFVTFPALRLLNRISLSSVLGRNVNMLNAVVNTNQGKTYIFADDWLVYEIDECSFRGNIIAGESVFQGVPRNTRGAFRYINGNIYFLTDSNVLEFNEFTGTATGAFVEGFDVLQVDCMRETLLSKLYSVIRYLEQ